VPEAENKSTVKLMIHTANKKVIKQYNARAWDYKVLSAKRSF
jgi:hypothetical protein